MSKLVLQPSMSTPIDCISASVGVFVGRVGVKVTVADGISVFVSVTIAGEKLVEVGVRVTERGGGMIIGVAVTTPGVRDGIGVQTGNG